MNIVDKYIEINKIVKESEEKDSVASVNKVESFFEFSLATFIYTLSMMYVGFNDVSYSLRTMIPISIFSLAYLILMTSAIFPFLTPKQRCFDSFNAFLFLIYYFCSVLFLLLFKEVFNIDEFKNYTLYLSMFLITSYILNVVFGIKIIFGKRNCLSKEKKELKEIEKRISQMDDKDIYKILKYSETLSMIDHSYFYPIYTNVIKNKFENITQFDVVHLKVKEKIQKTKINY